MKIDSYRLFGQSPVEKGGLKYNRIYIKELNLMMNEAFRLNTIFQNYAIALFQRSLDNGECNIIIVTLTFG